MNIQFSCFTFFDKKNNSKWHTLFLILLSQLIQFSHFSDVFIPIISLLSTTVVAFLPFYSSFSLHFLLSLFPLSFNCAFLSFYLYLVTHQTKKKLFSFLHLVVTESDRWLSDNDELHIGKTRYFGEGQKKNTNCAREINRVGEGVFCDWYGLKLWSKPKIVNRICPDDDQSPILWLVRPLL